MFPGVAKQGGFMANQIKIENQFKIHKNKNRFRAFLAPLGAPENLYTFYFPPASFPFILRAIWTSLDFVKCYSFRSLYLKKKKKSRFYTSKMVPGEVASVPETLWKPQKWTEHNFLHRSCTPFFLNSEKKYFFSRSKMKFWNFVVLVRFSL